MSDQQKQMMQVNIKGRAFVICQSHGITDPSIIGYYVQILEEATLSMLNAESSVADFHNALNEKAKWLEQEIGQLTDSASGSGEVQEKPEGEEDAEQQDSDKPAIVQQHKKATGYVPEAKSMGERLKDRRSEMEHLLLNDCVTLKLVSPKQAKKHVHELVGRDPKKAEEDLVANLRNALHQQVIGFIRKHNGGPWNSATEQTEIRMQIASTKTLQSLVNLSKMLLSEREEWMAKTKNSLVGRLFGGKVNLDK
ncbi:MAG: hypothetical protein MI756_17550 [Chromatiales bacterium]|nr:hypothetical protein [Chromatiales bacterium]